MTRQWLLPGLCALLACGPGDRANSDFEPPQYEPPVVTNPDPPVEYPADLYERGIEGTVVLQLFVTEEGTVILDSTQVAEASGYTAFDSAAMAGVENMHFAPARQNGSPVATVFLQPVHFRHPDRTEAAKE